MRYVRVFHNVETDEQDRPQGYFGYQANARLTLVFAYTESDDDAEPEDILEQAFHRFNVGEDPLAQEYRARRLRSLSVGDVVVIDSDAYAVGSTGYYRLHESLNTIDRADLHGTVPLSHV